MLPFPPRVFANECLTLNPLGTIPLENAFARKNRAMQAVFPRPLGTPDQCLAG
jgi:hypothetical protein